jgi:hypothetical protein
VSLGRQLKLARRDLRRVIARARWGRLDVPVFFGNSFPKSGTHLLSQVLAGLAELGPAVESGLPAVVTFDGPTGAERPVSAILADLAAFKPGDVGFGHLHGAPEILDQLCAPGCAPYFILRDPRDVVVSHVFYVTRMAPAHVHHAYYTQALTTFEQRLKTSILGRPEAAHPFPDIRERFAPYLPWLDRPEVLSIQFEDFILDRQSALARILAHAEARGFHHGSPPDSALDRLARRIDPARSPTFRSGKIGGWREHFTPGITELFKQVAGDLLIKLGYEEDFHW